MKSKIRYSDLMTTARIISVAIFAVYVSAFPTGLGLIPGLVILALIFLTDGLDGQIARRIDGESKLGAFYDIVGDRIAETVLLVPFVFNQHPGAMIALVYFIVKDFLVDFRRMATFMDSSDVPFKQVSGRLAEFITAGRFMRSFYAVIKLVMIGIFYVWLFDPSEELTALSMAVMIITLIVSFVRTVPSFISVKA
ncbi:MAG: CDP-diacylglycerol--glycerol-3-phosphate 3-phosphatidyltransferase [candidate division WS6 bacterium OLB20]|uniref:CDP-diacylglycerol--glycerol-3-phosphate 3-phosphatidyltransferase n=1 Tax=candidate division WS6 bacterium OLB20 TaxID=1617426 RepID=A0A136LW49_9BACT|nr:MAG: CDP-diacylglycerol--glycerol-3-phosphate 3-phosphatidyltransferase [candidate division WS6 bacterium OLB20]